jgi:hypothetical protein
MSAENTSAGLCSVVSENYSNRRDGEALDLPLPYMWPYVYEQIQTRAIDNARALLQQQNV